MKQIEIRLKPGSGLQAKIAAEFIQRASGYKSSVWVEKNQKRANAKSLLGLLALEISADSELMIIAEGEDEEVAVSELSDFIVLNV